LLPLGQRLAFVQGRVVDGVTVRTRHVKKHYCRKDYKSCTVMQNNFDTVPW